VVEDEEAVRTLAHRTLEEAGYKVLAAASGRTGLELLLSAEVDAVLCDLILPDMTGHELVRSAGAIRPDIPVLYTSGYPQRPAPGLRRPCRCPCR